MLTPSARLQLCIHHWPGKFFFAARKFLKRFSFGGGRLRFFFFFSEFQEGVNREKPTVKKITNKEMFFFTVYVPYKP